MKILRVVLVVLAAAVLALPPVFGWFTESQVHARVESLRENETLAVEVESYDRGWFSSTALVSIAPASAARAPGAGQGVEPLPLGTLFTRPLEVVVEFSHGPLSLRDGLFVGASEMVARPAQAAGGAGAARDNGASGRAAAKPPYAFEFRGRSTFDGTLHFVATLPAIEAEVEGGEVRFSGGRLAGTMAGRRLTAQVAADAVQWAKDGSSLSLRGIRASADNELLSRYRMPGTIEVAVARGSVDLGAGDPAATGGQAGAATSTLIDATGLTFRSEVELDGGGDLMDGSMSLGFESARTGNETQLANARIESVATRVDTAALEAYYDANGGLDDPRAYADELEPAIERLLAAGPTLTVDPLRVDVDGNPLEASVFIESDPAALPAASSLNLGAADFWYGLLAGRIELVATKELVERIATAVVKSQLASDFLEGSSVPFEALDTMAEAQAGFVIAMLAAQGMIEDAGTRYRTEVRLEGGKLTVNGKSLPVDALR